MVPRLKKSLRTLAEGTPQKRVRMSVARPRNNDLQSKSSHINQVENQPGAFDTKAVRQIIAGKSMKSGKKIIHGLAKTLQKGCRHPGPGYRLAKTVNNIGVRGFIHFIRDTISNPWLGLYVAETTPANPLKYDLLTITVQLTKLIQHINV